MTTPSSLPRLPVQSQQARARGLRPTVALLCRTTLAIGLAIILIGASTSAFVTQSHGRATAATLPTLSISPMGGTTGLNGTVDTPVSIAGTGFPAGQALTVVFNDAGTATPAGTITPDAAGNFGMSGSSVPALSFTVPAQAAPGSANITATGGGVSVGQPFQVVTLATAPSSAAPGQTVTLSDSGLLSGVAYTATLGGQIVAHGTVSSGSTGAIPLGVPVQPGGPTTLTLTSPAVSSTGTVFTATLPFTITSALTLTQSSAAPTATVGVGGQGFGGNEVVLLTFNGTGVGNATTDAQGSFANAQIVLPGTVAAGQGTVQATGQSSHISATTPLTITTAAKITLSTNVVTPGGSFQVTGQGFGSHEALAILFDKSQIATANSDANGTLGAVSVAIPGNAGVGPHTVTVRGISSNVSATASVTVYTIATPGISVTPTSGGAGTSVTAAGSGFAAGEQVNISIDGTLLTSPHADQAGNISGIGFHLPTIAGGNHTITARGASSGRQATTAFQVATALTVTPSQGPVGTRLMVSGSGMVANEPVLVFLFSNVVPSASAPSPSGANHLIGTGTATASGTFGPLAVTLPDASAGFHTVQVRGAQSNHTASTTVYVTPALATNTTNAIPGASVAITATGYAANETVQVRFDNGQIAQATADGNGAIHNLGVVIPANATATTHTLSIVGVTSHRSTSVTLTIGPATLTLQPTSGQIGSAITLSGSGFGFHEVVTLTLSNQTLLTLTTDNQGRFHGAVIHIPTGTTWGAHTITATGQTTHIVAHAILNTTGSFAVSQTSGTPGSTIQVSGSGFAPNARIDILLGNLGVGSVSTNGLGVFGPDTLSIPAQYMLGQTTIQAIGSASHQRLSVPFKVVAPAAPATLSVIPTAALPGSSVTFTGHNFVAARAVTVQIDNGQTASVLPDSQGTFHTSLVLSASVTPGLHHITASQSASGRTVVQMLTVEVPLPRVHRVYHFVGTLLPGVGAPLQHLEGALRLDVQPLNGDFTDHGTLTLSSGQVLSVSGQLTAGGVALHLVSHGVAYTAMGNSVSTNRLAGTFQHSGISGSLGFWAATAAVDNGERTGTFTGQITQGPDHGTTYAGRLTLLSDTYGGVMGSLQLSDGRTLPVGGQQVNGNLNLQIIVRSGTPMFVVGTATGNRAFTGEIYGPLAGDQGHWSTQLGAVTAANTGSNVKGATAQAGLTLAALTTGALPVQIHSIYHFVGSFVVGAGAPLQHLEGTLRLGINAATGQFTNDGTLTLGNGQVLTVNGSLSGGNLTLRFASAGIVLQATGQAVSTNRLAGTFQHNGISGTLGFWAATTVVNNAPQTYTFNGQVIQGPDHGTTYAGRLTLLSDTYGGVMGSLQLASGQVLPVSGQQVNGNLNLQIIVRSGTPMFVVGTVMSNHAFAGQIYGPLAGDQGTWTAQR